jgi:hypothetical protein
MQRLLYVPVRLQFLAVLCALLLSTLRISL